MSFGGSICPYTGWSHAEFYAWLAGLFYAAVVQVGCDPSLSSIPVLAQRSFADALAELAAWLARPTNQDDFLLVFLDDQPDIKDWVSSRMRGLSILLILSHCRC